MVKVALQLEDEGFVKLIFPAQGNIGGLTEIRLECGDSKGKRRFRWGGHELARVVAVVVVAGMSESDIS